MCVTVIEGRERGGQNDLVYSGDVQRLVQKNGKSGGGGLPFACRRPQSPLIAVSASMMASCMEGVAATMPPLRSGK